MPIQQRLTTAFIDLQALRHNIKQVVGKGVPASDIIGIIKANAYGHGSIMVARTMQSCGITKLAVATIEEAVELRDKGLRCELIVLGGLFGTDYAFLKEYSIRPVLHNWADFESVIEAIRDKDGSLVAHLKFDTGMGRLGFFTQDIPNLIKRIRYNPGLKIESVMTHLALADGSDLSQTLRQKDDIISVRQAFQDLGMPVRCHFANSAAIIDSLVDSDMWARPGLMLYGSYPAVRFKPLVDLKPVMKFKTTLLDIKKVPSGSGISYGHTFVTQRESLIGVLAVGYADGYSRALSGSGQVLIKGQTCPVVGRVCMDLTMVDLTDSIDIKIGDEVELWGDIISVDDVANKAGTISYELLCGVSQRVPRVFLNA